MTTFRDIIYTYVIVTRNHSETLRTSNKAYIYKYMYKYMYKIFFGCRQLMCVQLLPVLVRVNKHLSNLKKKESGRFLPGENTKEASIRDLSKTEGQTKQKIRNPAPVPGTV